MIGEGINNAPVITGTSAPLKTPVVQAAKYVVGQRTGAAQTTDVDQAPLVQNVTKPDQATSSGMRAKATR